MQTDSPPLYEGDGYAIAWKPPLMHSAPLVAGDPSLLTRYAMSFPEVLMVRGRKPVEGGLLHRLDYETRGLIVLAHRQKAFDELTLFQEEGRFVKEYRALCLDLRSFSKSVCMEGYPPRPEQEPVSSMRIESAFRPWGEGRRAVRPVSLAMLPSNARRRKELSFDRGGPYTTEILEITPLERTSSLMMGAQSVNIPLVMVRARLCRGFRHQIRAHLAWLLLPLLGDPLYAPKGLTLQSLLSDRAPFFLEACALDFPGVQGVSGTRQYRYESPLVFSV